MRSDFFSLGSQSQVSRALASLVTDGALFRVSKGAYAKTRINQFTGKPSPAGTLEMIAAELFHRLDIELSPSALVEEYNSGRSTQIPMIATVNTGKRRITRKVTVGNTSLVYERATSRTKSEPCSQKPKGLRN
jgi:hypothetical protein